MSYFPKENVMVIVYSKFTKSNQKIARMDFIKCKILKYKELATRCLRLKYKELQSTCPFLNQIQ